MISAEQVAENYTSCPALRMLCKAAILDQFSDVGEVEGGNGVWRYETFVCRVEYLASSFAAEYSSATQWSECLQMHDQFGIQYLCIA